jgi:hypothetical protein
MGLGRVFASGRETDSRREQTFEAACAVRVRLKAARKEGPGDGFEISERNEAPKAGAQERYRGETNPGGQRG